MDRHFDKLSISTSGLLGDHRESQPHHYQSQPHHYAQQQHQPGRQAQQPPSVYGSNRPRENGCDLAGGDEQRQRTGRIRQSRSSTWGNGGGASTNGPTGSIPTTSISVVQAAELDETVDLRRRAPSQSESPRTPRTPGSPRYTTTGPDDQHHLAAISPRGTAAATSAYHSYHKRDRHPSSSGGGGNGGGGVGLMVTEDDFRHAREANHHTGGGSGGDSVGWQQPRRGGPEDVSTRLLQKYKTDSLRVEATHADRRPQQQQQHPTGLSKSHDGFVVPRRLPPIGGAPTATADREDYDDDDDIECDGGGGGDEEDEANPDEIQRRQQRRKHETRQRRHNDEDQIGFGHKGRTRTN